LSSLAPDTDQLLLACTANETLLYRIGDVFEELRSREFNRSGQTFATGVFCSGSLWVQIVSDEIRVYDNGSPRRPAGKDLGG
jgi:cleavage and polyadenylation specificity factor subunit 1